MSELSVEEQARAQGWVPPEEFKGDPSKAKTAEEFLETGTKIQAIQVERNKALTRQITEMNARIAEMQRTFMENIKESKKSGYEQAKREILAEQKIAVENGDVEKFEQLEAKKDKLEKPNVTSEERKAPPKEFIEWQLDNDWYMDKSNPDHMAMTAYADAIGPKLAQQEPDLSPQKFYARVTAEIKKKFPDNFANAKRFSEAEVSGGKEPAAKSNGKKDFSALSKDLKDGWKAAAEKSGFYKDKEEYAKRMFEFYGEEANA